MSKRPKPRSLGEETNDAHSTVINVNDSTCSNLEDFSRVSKANFSQDYRKNMKSIIYANAKSRDMNPRFCCLVQETISHEFRFLLISDTTLDIFNSSRADLLLSYSWFNITKMHRTQLGIDFDFGSIRLSFVTEDTQLIIDSLTDMLPRILRPTELLSLGYFVSADERPPPTPNSAMLRLKERAFVKGTKLSNSTYDTFEKILIHTEEYLDLSIFENQQEALPYFFDLLPLCPEILSITIHSSEGIDVWSTLGNAVCEAGFLEHIHIDAVISKRFDSFLRSLAKNPDLPIYGLTFENSKLNETNIRSISKCMLDRSIYSIGFQNAILPDSMSYFYNGFLSGNIASRLTSLNLDHTPHPDLNRILSNLPSLEMLSLEDCYLDINEALASFSGKDVPSLRGLNLSKNLAKQPSTARLLRLPTKLTNLMINDVEWAENRFVEFFKMAGYGFKSGFRLSIANAKASQDEWNRAFSELRNLKINMLQAVVWDGNPLSSRFFSFLKKNSEIDYLSLSGCLNQNNTEYISPLSEYIISAHQLRSLIIKGIGRNRAGKGIAQILDSVGQSKSLEYLDVRNNKGSDIELVKLKALLSAETPLAFIIFDGVGVCDPKFMFDFLFTAAGNPRDIAVSFPSDDLGSLLQAGRISRLQLEWIRKLYKLPQPTVNNEPSPFEAPYEIYKEVDRPMFPQYLKYTGVGEAGARTEDFVGASGCQSRTDFSLSIDGENVTLIPKPQPIQTRRRFTEENEVSKAEVSFEELKTQEELKHRRRRKHRDPSTMSGDKTAKSSEKTAETKVGVPPPIPRLPTDEKRRKHRRKLIKKSPSNASEPPKVKETPKKRHRRKAQSAAHGKSTDLLKNGEPSWVFPIRFNFSEVEDEIISKAEKANDIDDLLDKIPKLKR